MIRAKHGPEAAKSRDDLVGNEKDVVPGQNGLDLVPIARRRRYYSACPQNWLPDEGGDRIRPLVEDQLFQLGGTVVGELLLAHRAVRPTEEIGSFSVQHEG